MTIFKNIKLAHEKYNYPSSYRFGTVGNEKGVLRSYSNGKNHDKILNNGSKVLYKIKNTKILNLFKLNQQTKQKVRFFFKIDKGVKDMGLYNVKKFIKKNDNLFIELVK